MYLSYTQVHLTLIVNAWLASAQLTYHEIDSTRTHSWTD